MQCSAIKRNCHPCRGFGSPTAHGDSLCHVHHDFFDQPQTLFSLIERNASIFQSQEEYAWCVRALKSPTFQNTLKRQALRSYACKRLEEMFADTWNPRDKAVYIHKMLLEAGILNPLDLKPLWRQGLLRQLRVLQFCVMQTPEVTPAYAREILQLLRPYFKNASPRFIIPYLLSLMAAPHFDTSNLSLAAASEMWRQIITFASKEMNMRPLACMDPTPLIQPAVEFHTKAHPRSVLLCPILQAHIYSDIKRCQLAERQKIRARILPLKEGIVAAAMRTDRLTAALDAGMELDDW